jgi:hypothetical protein
MTIKIIIIKKMPVLLKYRMVNFNSIYFNEVINK